MPSSGTHRAEGAAQKLGGKLKKGVGRLVGSERLQAEGRAAELRGKDREQNAKAVQRVKGKAEEVTGNIKNKIGKVIGNEQMQAEGKMRQWKGQARHKVNH